MSQRDDHFMLRAIQLAAIGMDANAGGPFGAVVVKDGEIIAEGHNQVIATNDPTAHAEMVVIREACRKLNSFQLADCVLYTSCEPCPRCLGAIYWARPKKVFYGCTKENAAAIDFDDQFIYDELEEEKESRKITFIQLKRNEAWSVFRKWEEKKDKTKY
jgi:tRNA(Arg) A34 adenosine deaminase TadA